ncbi:MAG: thioredoxin family protein [Bacilli bacterium]|nr:thioredoxin family protein [Bacilli bacterium]
MKIIKIGAMWCSACLKMHKYWDILKKNYPNIEIIEYDYDMDEDIVKQYEVNDILPVILFYQNDNLIARLDGEKTLEEIKNIIEN